MPMIPAFCNTCGAIFPSGIRADNCTNMSLSNCASGPCPACGGMGHIPDGVYNFIGDTIELLSGPGKTVNDLNKLAAILRHSQKKGLGIDQIKQQVQKEVPELASITDLFPKTRQDVYQYIIIILMIIGMLYPNALSDAKARISPNEVIDQINSQPSPQMPKNKIKRPAPDPAKNLKNVPKQIAKIGRNELCSCGSGLKYKKCCGKPT